MQAAHPSVWKRPSLQKWFPGHSAFLALRARCVSARQDATEPGSHHFVGQPCCVLEAVLDPAFMSLHKPYSLTFPRPFAASA